MLSFLWLGDIKEYMKKNEEIVDVVLAAKVQELLSYFKTLNRVAVAFSGGVDSTFLAAIAHKALGDNAVAITVDTPYIPRWELQEAKVLANEIGIHHEIIEMGIPQDIRNNPEKRCYLCKKVIFSTILQTANALEVSCVVDGTNFDDTADYRPGLVALKELEIKSPLMALGWTKQMIRSASEAFGLKTHDKPAYACLLTRIPHDVEITAEALTKIEAAEVFLMSKGFRAVRVRYHGNLARIEVPTEERIRLLQPDLLDEISLNLKDIGFEYVTIDAAGYKMGSLNRQSGQNETEKR